MIYLLTSTCHIHPEVYGFHGHLLGCGHPRAAVGACAPSPHHEGLGPGCMDQLGPGAGAISLLKAAISMVM